MESHHSNWKPKRWLKNLYRSVDAENDDFDVENDVCNMKNDIFGVENVISNVEDVVFDAENVVWVHNGRSRAWNGEKEFLISKISQSMFGCRWYEHERFCKDATKVCAIR